MVMTHYKLNLLEVSANGYIVAEHLTDDEGMVAIEEADTAVEGASKAMSSLFECDLFPYDDDDEPVSTARNMTPCRARVSRLEESRF